MSLLQAIVLGLIQGVTEFIPVSSSAHLALFPWMLHWPDQGLAYDIALHWGTLAALIVFFRRDLMRIASGALSQGDNPERRLAIGIVIATIPGAAAGLLLDDTVETLFRKPEYIALSLMIFGVLLGAADRFGRKRLAFEDIDWKLCLGIGMAQALAIFPGVSRSGITITAALFLGLKRVDSARFSFILAIPIVLGAGILKLKDLGPEALNAPFFIGIAVSALSGYAAIRFLLDYLKNRDLWIFSFYRVALGGLILFLVSAQPPHRDARELNLSPPVRPAAASLSPGAARLRGHVVALAGDIGERSISQPDNLLAARDYIRAQLATQGYRPTLQTYHSRFMAAVKNGTTFYNVIAKAGPALMLTDTASFRTPHYHKTSDTPDTLDYERMNAVKGGLLGVFRAVH